MRWLRILSGCNRPGIWWGIRMVVNPIALLKPGRVITGMSAVLLPFHEDGTVDWEGFQAQVERTAAAGLVPAVNMDTGYINLLTPATRREVLVQTQRVLSGRNQLFVAGAFVADGPGDSLNLDEYRRQITLIQS